MKQTVSFIFPIADIQKEVEKRSSYLGKMRVVAGSDAAVPQHQLDRMSLTKGEDFLFQEYLREAATETYDWIRAFGRHHGERAMRLYGSSTTHTIKENCGAKIVDDNGKEYGTKFLFVPTTDDWVMRYNPLHGTWQTEITLPDACEFVLQDSSDIKYRITYKYVVGVEDTPFEEVGVQTSEAVVLADTAQRLSKVSFEIPLRSTEWGDDYIKSVEYVLIEITEIVPAAALSAAKDEYIEYQRRDGTTEWYQVRGAISTDKLFVPVDWANNLERLEEDLRDSIVYRLCIPEWSDSGMYKVVDNRLREAIVNYILWRWFETVLQEEDRYSRYGQKMPHEAERYFEKYEEMAHQAQLGLNAEKQPLQRRYKWF